MDVQHESGFSRGQSEITYSKWVFKMIADSQGGKLKSPIVKGYQNERSLQAILKGEIGKSPVLNGCSK